MAELMATHLKWSKAEKEKQIKMATDYINQVDTESLQQTPLGVREYSPS